MLVEVYWNFNRKMWSIRDAHAKLVLHRVRCVELTDCTFWVSEAGRKRVLSEKRKNVHAMVRGTLVRFNKDDGSIYPAPDMSRSVRYNPYKSSTFVLESGDPIRHSPRVVFNSDGMNHQVWAVLPVGSL